MACNYPLSDTDVVGLFRSAVNTLASHGKRAKIVIFDTVSSRPGVRVPFEELTAEACKYGVLSCIDGAHAVGHIPIDLNALDPDFFGATVISGSLPRVDVLSSPCLNATKLYYDPIYQHHITSNQSRRKVGQRSLIPSRQASKAISNSSLNIPVRWTIHLSYAYLQPWPLEGIFVVARRQ